MTGLQRKIEERRKRLEHGTATPWHQGNGYPQSEYGIWRGVFFGLLARTDPDSNPLAVADAALIVDAVNDYEALLDIAAALEKALPWIGVAESRRGHWCDPEIVNRAHVALARFTQPQAGVRENSDPSGER